MFLGLLVACDENALPYRMVRWLWHTTERVWFLRILCLQDKLSTQSIIANFHSIICVQLSDTNVHAYCKAISLSCWWQRLLSCRKQCQSPIAMMAGGYLKSLPTYLTWILVTSMCFRNWRNLSEAADFKTFHLYFTQ